MKQKLYIFGLLPFVLIGLIVAFIVRGYILGLSIEEDLFIALKREKGGRNE
jgi:hypothetical protein